MLVDYRNERPGVKFNDADLIGCPYQVVIGEKGLKECQLELKERRTGTVTKLAPAEVANRLQYLLGPSYTEREGLPLPPNTFSSLKDSLTSWDQVQR